MSTITIPTLAGGVTDAGAVNDVFYKNKTDSLKALNGHLTSANISDAITSECIRDQSLAKGEMIGMTGLLDYPEPIFTTTSSAPGSFISIPGATQTFYLPYAPSLVIFTWQIALTNSHRTGTGGERKLKVFLDGSALESQTRDMPACRTSASPTVTTAPRAPGNDFFWAGHAVQTGMARGFHTVGLKLYSDSNTMRVRVRNIKVIWFK